MPHAPNTPSPCPLRLLRHLAAGILMGHSAFAAAPLPGQDLQAHVDSRAEPAPMESLPLILPDGPVGELEITVPLEGRQVRISLRPDSSRSNGFAAARAQRLARRMASDPISGGAAVALPPPSTMRGFLVGQPRSVVSASLNGGELSALIHDLDRQVTHVIEPDPARVAQGGSGIAHVVYRHQSGSSFVCGCTPFAATNRSAQRRLPQPHSIGHTNQGPPLANSLSPIRDLPIVIDTTAELFADWGLSEAEIFTRIESMLHHTSVLYEVQLGIRLRLYDYEARTDASAPGYPYLPLGDYTSGAELAVAARQVWFPTTQVMPWGYASVVTSRAILLHGGYQLRDICRRLVNGVPTGTAAATSFSSMIPTSSFARHTLVFAHELGHGFNITHNNPSFPDQAATGLMHPHASGGFFFSQPDLGYISNWLANTEDCYASGTPSFGPPVISSVSPSTQSVFHPSDVVLQGFELDGTYEITAGAVTLDYRDFRLEGAHSLRIHDLSALDVGTTTCTLHSIGGTATFDVTLESVTSPTLESDASIHPALSLVSLQMWGAPGGSALGIYSLAPSQTAVLGWPVLANRQPTTSVMRPLDGRGLAIETWPTGPFPGGTTIWMQFAEYQPGLGFTGSSNTTSFTVQ